MKAGGGYAAALMIDVMDRREITRTPVGERCTNVVVAYEKIEQGT